jgi:hypothetical protein
MSSSLLHEMPSRKDLKPPPNANPFHTAAPIKRHLAISPTQALSGRLLCSAFSLKYGTAPTKDSPSAPHSKNAANFFSALAIVGLRQGYPPSPLETASTGKKFLMQRSEAVPKLAHAAPPPPNHEDTLGNQTLGSSPTLLNAFFETPPTPAHSFEPYGPTNLSPPANVVEMQPS